MHRSNFFGKKKTFALYDCCDFFKLRQKGVSVRPLPTTTKKIWLHIYILGVGWDGNLPHIYIYFEKVSYRNHLNRSALLLNTLSQPCNKIGLDVLIWQIRFKAPEEKYMLSTHLKNCIYSYTWVRAVVNSPRLILSFAVTPARFVTIA